MDILSLVIPEGLCITNLTHEDDTITIYAQTASSLARCPLCHRLSSRVHSRYSRILSDLPWAGKPVCLQVIVRKFYCTNSLCARKVFAERLDGLAEVHGRRTTRQHQALEDIAFALGGEAGARLAAHLGLCISPDTLLRYIRKVPDPQALPLSVLGVDDWAWRRRYRYGTILVDLQRHRVVDLLEDRSSVSFASWLQCHPRVRIISRDRGGEYAEGASRGAPDAVQVADRFHLIKNLSEAVEKVFKRHIPLLARIPMPDSPPRMLSPPRPDREAAREQTRNKTTERSQMIHSLARKGMNKSAIARALVHNQATLFERVKCSS